MNNSPEDISPQLPRIPTPLFRAAQGVAYTLCLLVCIEIAARAFVHLGPIFGRFVGWDDSSSRIGWVNRHHRGKDPADSFIVYDPMRGWTLASNLRGLTVFGGKTLSSNSKGIRGNTEYPYQRQPGRQRILVLGDSFTFGDEVSDDETYAHYLEELLPGTEVLNMGISGYGHDQMLLYLKGEGVKYKPDVVVVGFVWFDCYRSLLKFLSFSKPRFELRGGKLVLTNTPVPTPESVLSSEWYQPKTLDLGVMLRGQFERVLGLMIKHARTITTAILDEIVATTRQVGARPAFVYLPMLDELENSNTIMTPNEQYLFSYCEESRVPCLFLRQRFLEERKRGVACTGRRHWDPNCHATAAQSIRDFLVEKGLIWERASGRP
ncbi:MAG: hypothetical protein DMG23_13445 [Acidobacteria bacterium]|nr:MAG: hypothetical protein DMG23_13445 [Acidobacteriota bacterium]